MVLSAGNVATGDVAVEVIPGVRVFVLIVVSAAEVIEIPSGVPLLGQTPGKTHHWDQALVTEHHLSFVTYTHHENLIS